MTKNFNTHIINEQDYHNAVDHLINNYEKRHRLVPTPSDSKQNQQKIIRIEQFLKEIKELIRQEDLQFRLIFDEDYQYKIRCQIQFINMLTIMTNELFEAEALDNQIKARQETENLLRFKDLDEKKREELRIAFENIAALVKEEKQFILAAILMSELNISNIKIEQYTNIKTKLNNSLIILDTSFNNSLRATLSKSELFHHLLQSEIDELRHSLKKICDDVDIAYLNNPALKEHLSQQSDHQKHTLTYSKQRHSKQEHDLIKYNEKKNNIINYLKKHHKKPTSAKYKPLDLKDSPQYERLAEEAIHMHEAYVKEKNELEMMIKDIDKKIELEETKKRECLEKMNQLIVPGKRTKYKKIIENTFDKLETKFVKEKERLKNRKEEKEIGDAAIKILHPEIFGPQKIETRKNKQDSLVSEPASTLLPPAEQDPSKRKWKTHVARKPYTSKNKPNLDPKARSLPPQNPKGKK